MKLCAGLALPFLLLVVTHAFADDPLDAQNLVQGAHDAVTLDKIGSYELRGNIVIYGKKPKAIAGQIRILRSGDLGRVEFQLGPYEVIRITQPGKQYLVRSRDYMPDDIHFLSTFRHPWDPMPDKPRLVSLKFSRSYQQKINGAEAVCVSEKSSFGERFMCFDSAQHVLLRRDFAGDGQIEYADYVPFENGPLFPKSIVISKSGKPVLEIKDIVIEKRDAGEAEFAPPSGAIEFEKLETCENPTPPRVLKSANPSFEGVKHSGKALLFVIVGKDGSILMKHEDYQGKGKLKESQVMEITQQTLKQWRFSPAMCGSQPVITEAGIEMNFERL